MKRFLVFFLALFLAGQVFATPLLLPVQGKLRGNNALDVNASLYMSFRLYNAASGGEPLWDVNKLVDVNIVDLDFNIGAFSTLLGEDVWLDINTSTDFNYLGIQIGNNTEMVPRIRIGSTAYAFRALRAEDSELLDGNNSLFYTNADNINDGTLSHAFYSDTNANTECDNNVALTGDGACIEFLSQYDANNQFVPYIGAVSDINTGLMGITSWDGNFFTFESDFFFGGEADFTGPVTGIALNEIENPTANKNFNMGQRELMFSFVNTTGNSFDIEAIGAFSGDVLHVHQHTGNPGPTHLVHIEAEDADVLPLEVTGPNGVGIFVSNGDVNINEDLNVLGGIFATNYFNLPKDDVNNTDVTLSNLFVDNNVNVVGDLNVLASVSSPFFFGDGSGLINVSALVDVNGKDIAPANVVVDNNLQVIGDTNLATLGISDQTFALDFINLHATPTKALHAATKEYVDMAVAGADFDLFLFEVASTDVGGYQQLQQTASLGVEDSDATSVGADNTLLQAFATEQSDLNIFTLSEGVYQLHIHASATTAGVQDARIFWRFFQRNAIGDETQIGSDSEESAILTASQTDYDIHLSAGSETTVDGNRFVVKVYANLEGAGGNPTITIFYEGITSSRAEFRTVDLSQTSHDLLNNREWADANHTFIQTGQTMDIGSYSLTTTGDINSANLGTDFLFVGGVRIVNADTNANTECADANAVLTSAGICQGISGFHIDTTGSADVNGQDINPTNVFIDYNVVVQGNTRTDDLNADSITATNFFGGGFDITGIPQDLNFHFLAIWDFNNNYYGKIDVNAQFCPYFGAVSDMNTNSQGITTWDFNSYTAEADFFFGDGAGLTNVTATADVNQTDINPSNIFVDNNVIVYGDLEVVDDANFTGIGIFGSIFADVGGGDAFVWDATDLTFHAGFDNNLAAGSNYQTAFGQGHDMKCDDCFTAGFENIVLRDQGIALGSTNLVAGQFGIALGNQCQSLGQTSICLGESLTNYAPNSVLVNDLNATDINATNIQADFFFGDGSGITNVTAVADVNDTDVQLSNLFVDNNVNVGGDVNVGVNIGVDMVYASTGLHSDANVSATAICFPSPDNCQMWIDYNGSAITIAGG